MSSTQSKKREGKKAPAQKWEARCGEVLEAALAFSRKTPDWGTFFREILGPDGIVHQMFPTPEALDEFRKTRQHREILALLAKLRQRNARPSPDPEPTQVITIRLPRAVHEALCDEADEHRTSLNRLCVSKLLQFIEDEMVPSRRYRRRVREVKE